MRLFYAFFKKKLFLKPDDPLMIVAKLFLELNEPLVSIDRYTSHCCMYRTIPEAVSIRKGKIMYTEKK